MDDDIAEKILRGEDKLLIPAEVASIFGVHTKTVMSWALRGKLRSFRTPGGEVRFLRSDIEELVCSE